jgi:glycosyltransferase involved in cell wall biosynthesis
MSTDRTVEKARTIIKNDPRFIIIENRVKMFQPGNYDQVIRNNDKISDNEVCVELDGDDWFSDQEVLQRIANVYRNNFIWLAMAVFNIKMVDLVLPKCPTNGNQLGSRILL